MNAYAYVDGRFLPYGEARLPLSDRSVFFADAVYDACLIHHGRIYEERAHVARLFGNLHRLGITPPANEPTLTALLEQAAALAEGTAFLYIQVSRSAPSRTHAVPKDADARLLLTVTEQAPPDPSRRLRLITAEDVRYRLCDIKTTNLLPNVLAATRAAACGADEAVFIREGTVTECAHSNICILKGGRLLTHPLDGCVLPGITRGRLLTLAGELGIPVDERPFDREALLRADDILVTSTTKLALRAEELDGMHVGGRSREAERLTEALYRHFSEQTTP